RAGVAEGQVLHNAHLATVDLNSDIVGLLDEYEGSLRGYNIGFRAIELSLDEISCLSKRWTIRGEERSVKHNRRHNVLDEFHRLHVIFAKSTSSATSIKSQGPRNVRR